MEKNEIIQKRVGGLGSSDAKMVARIGRNGQLNDADNQRIAIMLGLEEKKQFSTQATEFGDIIENKIFEIIKEKYPKVVSNPFYKSEELSGKYGFDIFNHIDYSIETPNKLIWIECKATKKGVIHTAEEYKEQLAWHKMLLQDKALKRQKTPILMLAHYQVEDYDFFDASKFTLQEVSTIMVLPESKIFEKGLEIIASAIQNFEYEPREELYAENLPLSVQNKLAVIRECFLQIDEHQKKIDAFKNTMLKLMKENNVKSIKNDFFNLTFVPESKSIVFDKKAFEKENPELSKKYQKEQIRKEYLTIKIK